MPYPAIKSARALLIDTLILFKDPSRWTQGTLARTAPNPNGSDGRPCSPHSPEAFCFCLEGGLRYSVPKQAITECADAQVRAFRDACVYLKEAAKALKYDSYIELNDACSISKVRLCLALAIDLTPPSQEAPMPDDYSFTPLPSN